MQTKTETSKVRWMTAKDMPQVSSLARNYLPNLRVTDKNLMEFSTSRNHIPKVIVSGPAILGFTLYVVRGRSIEILAICIGEKETRRGLGRKLLEELKQTARKLGKDCLTCLVPEHNLNAQLFFKALGFRWTSTIDDAEAANSRWVDTGTLYKMQCSNRNEEAGGA